MVVEDGSTWTQGYDSRDDDYQVPYIQITTFESADELKEYVSKKVISLIPSTCKIIKCTSVVPKISIDVDI